MTVEERKIGARLRERFRYLDSLPESVRYLAAMGVPEDEWPTYVAFSEETIGMMRGTLVRRFVPNPRMMEYQQPVGHWETVRRGTDTSDT